MTMEEAIRIIETVFQDEYVYKYYDSITHQALDMAIEALSADAIEVVRCEDCVHFTGLNERKTWGICNAHGRTAQDIDYCSWGERREP